MKLLMYFLNKNLFDSVNDSDSESRSNLELSAESNGGMANDELSFLEQLEKLRSDVNEARNESFTDLDISRISSDIEKFSGERVLSEDNVNSAKKAMKEIKLIDSHLSEFAEYVFLNEETVRWFMNTPIAIDYDAKNDRYR